MLAQKIALGTANFGQRYGVANLAGHLSSDQIKAILHEAFASGIRHLDTAVAYGDSEKVLGRVGLRGWSIITKLPPLPPEEQDAQRWVHRLVAQSLERLNIQSLEGVLMHRPADLLESSGQEIYDALHGCKTEGFVSKIGISIYDPSELDSIICRYPLDIVQAPYNVLDRRLATSGWMQRLHSKGLEIHVRSAFLQGLLLMAREDRPAKFNRWNPVWNAWHEWLCGNKIEALHACLGWVMTHPEVTKIVVGVDGLRHLREILSANELESPVPPESLARNDLDLINPSRWPSL